MKIAILQSNFAPWRGYFHLINSVDIFILYDCVQYTKNDWRNRNKILSKNGVQWLTLQVIKPYSKCSIDKVLIEKKSLTKAIASLEMSYRKAKTFDILEELVLTPMKNFVEEENIHLSALNEVIIRNVAAYYNISTKIVPSEALKSLNLMSIDNKVERLVSLISIFRGEIYLSGPSGLNYLDTEMSIFEKQGIELQIMNYPQYSKYKQFSHDFEENLSIIDFIAHVGTQKDNLFQ